MAMFLRWLAHRGPKSWRRCIYWLCSASSLSSWIDNETDHFPLSTPALRNLNQNMCKAGTSLKLTLRRLRLRLICLTSLFSVSVLSGPFTHHQTTVEIKSNPIDLTVQSSVNKLNARLSATMMKYETLPRTSLALPKGIYFCFTTKHCPDWSF